jgi:hypothetical protein
MNLLCTLIPYNLQVSSIYIVKLDASNGTLKISDGGLELVRT